MPSLPSDKGNSFVTPLPMYKQSPPNKALYNVTGRVTRYQQGIVRGKPTCGENGDAIAKAKVLPD